MAEGEDVVVVVVTVAASAVDGVNLADSALLAFVFLRLVGFSFCRFDQEKNGGIEKIKLLHSRPFPTYYPYSSTCSSSAFRLPL